MKTLRQIQEGFFQNSMSGYDASLKYVQERLKIILKDYFYFTRADTKELNEKYVRINEDLTVDILYSRTGSELVLLPDKDGLGVQFGKVNLKKISIYNCKEVTNLTGLPKNFDGQLTIHSCDNLQYISDNDYGCNDIIIRNCPKLRTVKGMPRKISGSIVIWDHVGVETLDGCAKEIGGGFKVSRCDKLTSLKGCPSVIGKKEEFIVYNCDLITSIKDMPSNIHRVSLASLPKLSSLEGSPVSCFDYRVARCNGLKDLTGAPRVVRHIFDCDRCENLKTLEGGPTTVGYHYICTNTGITSLKGCVKECGTLDCRGCIDLSSLDGFPDIVKWDFQFYGCPNLKFKKSEIINKVKGKITKSKTV